MKPFMLWCLSLIVMGLVMGAGCAKREARLTFMTGGTPSEIAFWEQLCEQFKADTGIAVELIRSTTQTGQRKQQIQVGLRGRQPDPDVFTMDIAWISQLAHSGWLEPLDRYAVDASVCFSNVVALADRHAGHLIGVPLWIDAGLLYYRSDLLRQYGFQGPPDTWQELINMSRTVQQQQRATNPQFWGYVWQGAQYEGLICNALEVFASAGGGFFDQQDRPTIDSPPNVAALTLMAQLIHQYAVSPPNVFTDMQEEDARLMFQKGDALFERNWSYAMKLQRMADSPVRSAFAIAPLPHFKGRRSAATLGGWHVGISRFSDRKADAAAFVRYLISYDVQKRLALEQSQNPARPDVYSDADIADTDLAALRPILERAIPRPVLPYYPQVSTILQKHINAALAAKVTPKEALSQAQAEVEMLLKEMNGDA